MCAPIYLQLLQSVQRLVCSGPAGDNHRGLVTILTCCWRADCLRCPRSLGHWHLHGNEGPDLTSSSGYTLDTA